MKLKVVITGASGMVGRGLLLEAIDSSEIDEILVVNRKSIGINNPKVKELLVTDFNNISEHSETLAGYDACFFCAGISSVGLTEQQYTEITYHLTLEFARVFKQANPDSKFIYVSGMGTDSTKTSKQMWARVKGQTENDLLAMGFRDAYMMRPAFIYPERGIKSRTRLYNVGIKFFSPFYPLLKRAKKYVTNTTTLSRVMIYLVIKGYRDQVLENYQINAVYKNYLQNRND